MSFLQVQDLAKRYGDTTVFERVSFTMEKGEFVCIIGHSGCGKTTILNVLAGLDHASEGGGGRGNPEGGGPPPDARGGLPGPGRVPGGPRVNTNPFPGEKR